MSALHQMLGDFAGRANAHPSLRNTLQGWSPEFFIQTIDSGECFQIHLDGAGIDSVLPTSIEPGDEALLLRGGSAVLQAVFSGDRSPLGAYTDGQLEVYGNPKDQIKLDVIALVLWGA